VSSVVTPGENDVMSRDVAPAAGDYPRHQVAKQGLELVVA
jgi:hypothetical protein